MIILQIANGNFFSTFGGGQVYVKNLVDEMINQKLNVHVISLKETANKQSISEKDYRGITIYEISSHDIASAEKVIQTISPDIIHIHAQKALFTKLSRKLGFTNLVTAHHGGITCPAGTLLNYKDEICRISANRENCFPCIIKSLKGGKFYYHFFNLMSSSFRLKLSYFIKKLPFIYFVTPIGTIECTISEKLKEWKDIVDHTDLIIAPSHAIMENMIINGMQKNKIQLVPHGIPLYKDIYSSESMNSLNKVIKFFYVGRICHIKGTHLLLEAFSQISNNQCELHLIGDINGKYEKNLVNKYKKNNHIIFHGKINPDKIYTKIKDYDIMIHPTICLEVFGLNIAEALSLSKPVIATRSGGPEMQIEDNINGLLIPPNNVKSIKEAIIWMINHTDEVTEMSKKAPFYVISITEHVKSLFKIYKSLKQADYE